MPESEYPKRRHLTGYDRLAEGGVPDRGQLTMLLNRATIAQDAMKAQWRRGLNLNTHERQAIAHLWEAGRMSMSELGDKLALSRAAMTALIDRLEGLGYVERTVDELDRRRTLISPTERPYVRITPLAVPYHESLMEFAHTLDEGEWRAVVAFLDRLHDIGDEQLANLLKQTDEDLRAVCDEAEQEYDERIAAATAAPSTS